MKNLFIIALLLLTGFATNAQSTDLTNPEKLLVGTWEVQQQDRREIRLESLVFFDDGTININYARVKRVQRYKVLVDEKGYTLQLLQILNGKPLENIKILQLNKAEMEIGYEDDTRKLAVRLKKTNS
jgi:hypothetical protein